MSVYIVTGFMRSGTSMMMQALEAGGLEAVSNPERDKMNTQYGDEHYKVNDGGFYELTSSEYRDPAFPDNCDGKLVKYLWGGMLNLSATGNHRYIIFMRRPVEEIAKSYEAAFGHAHPRAIPELDANLDKIQAILAMRRDVTLTVVDYHDVINDPEPVFNKLYVAGWPIDSVKAAVMVNPDLHRHRAA